MNFTNQGRITEMAGTGYGDRDFSYTCHKCGNEVDHDLLRVAKFKKDTENLIMKDWPLGGTILAPTTGIPDAPTGAEWPTNFNTFPNRLIGIELRSKILELVNANKPTMNNVKELIERAIADKAAVKRVNSTPAFGSGALRRQERLAIRKMMSRYWENPSIFALELGGAVLRQSVFVDKMYGLDVRSPFLYFPPSTFIVSRFIKNFFNVFSLLLFEHLYVNRFL